VVAWAAQTLWPFPVLLQWPDWYDAGAVVVVLLNAVFF